MEKLILFNNAEMMKNKIEFYHNIVERRISKTFQNSESKIVIFIKENGNGKLLFSQIYSIFNNQLCIMFARCCVIIRKCSDKESNNAGSNFI